ncbi:hypothetical protein TNCV_429931 [Trichonephila clavipes]|nr:hypothetical protein TNCV_429931 [Trichonephila clavipes]
MSVQLPLRLLREAPRPTDEPSDLSSSIGISRREDITSHALLRLNYQHICKVKTEFIIKTNKRQTDNPIRNPITQPSGVAFRFCSPASISSKSRQTRYAESDKVFEKVNEYVGGERKERFAPLKSFRRINRDIEPAAQIPTHRALAPERDCQMSSEHHRIHSGDLIAVSSLRDR